MQLCCCVLCKCVVHKQALSTASQALAAMCMLSGCLSAGVEALIASVVNVTGLVAMFGSSKSLW